MVDRYLRTKHPRAVLVGATVSAATIAIGIAAIVGGRAYTISGDTDPGRVTTIVVSLLRVAAESGGAVCVGALMFALIATTGGKAGRIGVDGYSAVILAGRAGLIWTSASAALVAATAADSAGEPLAVLARPQALPALIGAQEPPKAWLAVAALAAVVTLGLRYAVSTATITTLAAIGVLALLPPSLAGNAAQGTGHDVGTNAIVLHVVAVSVYLGATVALLAHLYRGGSNPLLAVRRYTNLAAVCWTTTLVTGVALTVILLPAGSVLTTSYGITTIATVIAIAALAVTGGIVRRRMRAIAAEPFPRLRLIAASLAVDLVLLMSAMGGAVAMAHQPAPTFYQRPPDATEVLIGYDLPSPPTVMRLLTLWRPDLLLGGAAVLLAAAYLFGIHAAGRSGHTWPPARTIAWMTGCVALLILTCSGINTYSHAMFSMHMLQHMALNMLVPALLVLGTPLTLADLALRPTDDTAPGLREWLAALASSPVTRLMTHPAVAVGLYAATLFGVYFTGFYELLARYHWIHQLASIEFLVSGYAFFWAVLGGDRGPRRLPYLGRLGLLLAIMPITALFGIALLTTHRVIGNTFYHYLAMPWMPSLINDQRLGGLIGWLGGEIPMLLAAVVLLWQWSTRDRGRRDTMPPTTVKTDPYSQMIDQLARARHSGPPPPTSAPLSRNDQMK